MNPLHEAIKRNDVKLFTKVISSPQVNINQKNENGQTPLLFSLKLQRSDHFILALLDSKCDVTLCDEYRTTPLYIALTDRRFHIASQLMKMGADLAEDLKISNKYLCDAIQIKDWDFVWFLLHHEPNLVHVFLRGLQSRKVELDSNLALFALLTELDNYLSDDFGKKWYNLVGLNLVQYSIGLIDADIFNIIWPRLDHQCIFYFQPEFFRRYFDFCNFSTQDFVDCLNMILSSPHVSTLFNFYKNKNTDQSFFVDLLNTCVRRGVEIECRIMYMCVSFRYISVNILDIFAIYGAFRMDQETLFLIQHFPRESLTNNEYHQKLALEFLRNLENGDRLEPTNLSVLELIAKVNFNFSHHWFDKTLLENVCLKQKLPKKQVVPSLFELSTDVSQRHLQNVYKLKNPDQFQHAVQGLCLPRNIETRLCFKIPISYHNNSA